ncbi:MAG TPA: DUF2474 family protein [Devosia sp.]|nr:DUF2474 family protein [Devosia sp.]
MAGGWRKLAWFAGIWLASVAVLLACSYLIRMVLAP